MVSLVKVNPLQLCVSKQAMRSEWVVVWSSVLRSVTCGLVISTLWWQFSRWLNFVFTGFVFNISHFLALLSFWAIFWRAHVFASWKVSMLRSVFALSLFEHFFSLSLFSCKDSLSFHWQLLKLLVTLHIVQIKIVAMSSLSISEVVLFCLESRFHRNPVCILRNAVCNSYCNY